MAILGGTGFAGRNVREELEGAGMTVEVFSRTSGCDLLDLPHAFAKLDHFRPTHIVNCAAMVGSVNYVADFAADVFDHNMRLLLNIYKIAQEMRETVVINPVANCAYPGTADVYEESQFWSGPIHPSVLSYGSTRRMMEVLATCNHAQYGVRSANIFVPNMYGPHDSISPNKTHALNALVIKFVTATKQNLPEIEVWGTGKPIREWLYVKDFARAVRSVVQYKGVFPGPVNIAQNHGLSVDELVDILKKELGFKGQIVKNTKYPDGSPKKVMDDRRFKQVFPDFRFTPLAEGLRATVRYYREIL